MILFMFYDYLNEYIGYCHIKALSLQIKSFALWILKRV